jgi:hypothetical protein
MPYWHPLPQGVLHEEQDASVTPAEMQNTGDLQPLPSLYPT